jgi:dTDP-4-amino-4,6-dideoxygalactose transaminase
MITTNDSELAERLRQFRDHGAALSDLQRHQGPRPYLLADHPVAGLNQRMTDIQAALGLSQMKRAHEILNERRDLATTMRSGLADCEFLQLPRDAANETNGWQSFPCIYRPDLVSDGRIDECNRLRNEFMEALETRGVSTRPATHAVHMLTHFRTKYELIPTDFPNAYAADQCSISLPLFNGMTQEEVRHVIDVVRSVGNE